VGFAVGWGKKGEQKLLEVGPQTGQLGLELGQDVGHLLLKMFMTGRKILV